MGFNATCQDIVDQRDREGGPPGHQNTFGSISVSTLSFVASGEDNGKKLTCEAQNPKLPESALHDSWNLNVLYPPQLSLVFGASVQYEHIREGSDVYFECNIQANPPVSEVKWRFNAKNLVHDSLRGHHREESLAAAAQRWAEEQGDLPVYRSQCSRSWPKRRSCPQGPIFTRVW
ncbi:nephrin [Caerostris extrusa]|uniref:Nephrin n=1 Tax=Caerostris extrusa TaxID=172846 RepID=A0AAV4Y4B8_CAEEX|nr:nephrin [Caerostris extrusa]